MKKIPLVTLSRFRAQYMGIAIVCIMLCHNSLHVPEALVEIRSYISSLFQCGVDVFMVLSGLGLYYSFTKTPNCKAFWKKRFIKILIPYVIVVLLYAFVYVGYFKNATLGSYLWAYSLVSFFTDASLSIWFISAILLLYLIFPLLYVLLDKKTTLFRIGTYLIIIGCVTIAIVGTPKVLYIINEIFISRLPAFLFGMFIAKRIHDNNLSQKVNVCSATCITLAVVSFALIACFMVLKPTFWWTVVRLLFLPFVFSVMMLSGTIMDKLNKKTIDKVLVFLGSITLELYLLHERILSTLNQFSMRYDLSPYLRSIVNNILAIVLSLVGAWILHVTVNAFIGVVFAKKRK